MKKHSALLSVLLGLAWQAYGQNDPLYNQYQFNQLLINPAYTGVNDRMTATAISRLQWMGVPGAPVSNSVSLHTSIKTTHMGLGITFLNDELGVNANNELNVSYSYRLDFNKTKLQFGLQGGVISFNYDYSKLNLEYLDDPYLQTQQSKNTKPNIGAGIFYSGSNFFLGLSIPRMIDVKVNDGMMGSVRYRRTEYISGGYLLKVNEQLMLKPSVLLKVTEGAPFTYDINMNALFAKTIWVGLTYRNQTAMGFNTMLQISDRFRFGYTYELPFEPINFNNSGTHELMISVDFSAFSNQILSSRWF